MAGRKCTIWNYRPHLERDGTFKPVYQYSEQDSERLSHYIRELFKTAGATVSSLDGMRKNKRTIGFYDWFAKNEPSATEELPDAYFAFVAVSRVIRDLLRLEINRPTIQLETRIRIRIRDNCVCKYCGKKGDMKIGPDNRAWHVDHQIPYSFGGSDDDENLALACSTCNTRKHNKTHDEFMKIITNGGYCG